MTAHIVLLAVATVVLIVALWAIVRQRQRTIGTYCIAIGMVLVILGQTASLIW